VVKTFSLFNPIIVVYTELALVMIREELDEFQEVHEGTGASGGGHTGLSHGRG
jgi:hypothetical protein